MRLDMNIFQIALSMQANLMGLLRRKNGSVGKLESGKRVAYQSGGEIGSGRRF